MMHKYLISFSFCSLAFLTYPAGYAQEIPPPVDEPDEADVPEQEEPKTQDPIDEPTDEPVDDVPTPLEKNPEKVEPTAEVVTPKQTPQGKEQKALYKISRVQEYYENERTRTGSGMLISGGILTLIGVVGALAPEQNGLQNENILIGGLLGFSGVALLVGGIYTLAVPSFRERMLEGYKQDPVKNLASTQNLLLVPILEEQEATKLIGLTYGIAGAGLITTAALYYAVTPSSGGEREGVALGLAGVGVLFAGLGAVSYFILPHTLGSEKSLLHQELFGPIPQVQLAPTILMEPSTHTPSAGMGLSFLW